jgi:hypothetical protein
MDRLPHPHSLRQLVCDTGVRTILVNLAELRPDRRAAWLSADAGAHAGLTLLWTFQTQLVFEVVTPAAGAPDCGKMT